MNFEFSPIFILSFKIILAVVLGGLVGMEREISKHAAGVRTYGLVSLGSAVFTILSMNGFGASADPSRVASQIVVGIGFLGAGMILHKQDYVVGLTTSAGIWVAAAVGMAVGTGNYYIAIATSLITLLLFFMNDSVLHKDRPYPESKHPEPKH